MRFGPARAGFIVLIDTEPPEEEPLLLEDGSELLLEDDTPILLE